MTLQLPETAVGRQIRWFLGRLADPAALSAEERAEHFQPSATVYAPPLDDPRGWAALRDTRSRFDGATVTPRSDTAVDVEGVTPEGRRWRYRFGVDAATGRLTELTIEWVQEETVSVRRAVEADGPVLADIERRSPLVLGDTRITIDRGDDYFACARLMEDVAVAVAEVDGRPGAVNCAAAHTMCVGGRPYRMGYFHHLRILPEHQRKGLFQKLSQSLSDYVPPHVDGTYAYVSPANAASQRLFSFAEAWPVSPLMAEVPVAGRGTSAAGRSATPDDVAQMVQLLNAGHRDEEMFCPYTAESLAARLQRAPAQYSWSSVKIADGAVAGVWPAGDSFRVIVDSPEGRRVEREGYLLDHGFLRGAEAEFEALVRAWCRELEDRGFTRLVTFTSQWSANRAVLAELGAELQPFDLFVFGPPRPDGADRRGVYVDLVYF